MNINYKDKAQQLAELLKDKGISNEAVLAAIKNTPRHVFIDPSLAIYAYDDTALPITDSQTISQPFVVARMTELLLANNSFNKVLEVGTGSGYQAAVLAQLVNKVYSIERIFNLYDKANSLLQQLRFTNIFTRFGDGNNGWPEAAPFDGIIVTAATEQIPENLLMQLAEGGKMIIPIGDTNGQVLKLITRHHKQFKYQDFDPVIFVPLLSGIHNIAR